MSFEEQLIEEVRRNEVLYDLQHHNYRRVDIKEKIWKQIARDLNSTQEQFKKRWKSLRDKFKKITRDEISHPSGSGMEEPGKKWKYLEILSFLQGVNNPNETISSVTLEADDLFSENDDDVTQTVLTRQDDVFKGFKSFLDTATSTFIEGAKSSTAKLFEALAERIDEAHLMPEKLNE